MDRQDAQNHDDSLSGADLQDMGRLSIAAKKDLPSQDLQKWYDEYMATDGDALSLESEVILAVKDDVLDNETFEKEVENFAAHVENGFCLQCQTLFNNWPDLHDMASDKPDAGEDFEFDDEGWEHLVSAKRFTTPQLEASTRQGCRFCALIRQVLVDGEALETYRKVEGRLVQFTNDSKIALSIQNWASEGQLLWPNLPGKVCISCNSGSALELKFETSVIPVPDNSSIARLVEPNEDVLESARGWLKTCTEEHERCKAEETSVLPTRLLSIEADPPRLVLTADLTTKPRYATLSHRWSENEPSKLIAENLKLRLNSIPLKELPKSFIDAIKIARELGLSYLWIDALCIIQDDEEDWLKESSLMSSVYGGTSLNIAASSATDASKGCFPKPCYYSGGLRAKITMNGQERVQDFKGTDAYEQATSKSFLATRAWALQEKLLAPRTIHFGDRGAFWECGTTIASEFLPDGFGHYLVNSLVSRGGVGLRDYWRDIVMLYSAADLTYGKDKLPALSGIARKTHSESEDQYLAGIWKEDIETQLCWKPDVPGVRPPWRAPTWAWTSVDGRVMYPVNDEDVYEDVYTHIVDADITTAGEDPFGQVTHAVLRLSCSTIVVGNVDEDDTLAGDSSRGQSITITSGDEIKKFRVLMDYIYDKSEVNKKPVYLLPIIGGETGMSDDDGYMLKVHGILLQETGISKGEFRRVGSFIFTKNPGGWCEGVEKNEDYEPFLEILEETGTKTVEGVCAEVISKDKHPKERYVITVV